MIAALECFRVWLLLNTCCLTCSQLQTLNAYQMEYTFLCKQALPHNSAQLFTFQSLQALFAMLSTWRVHGHHASAELLAIASLCLRHVTPVVSAKESIAAEDASGCPLAKPSYLRLSHGATLRRSRTGLVVALVCLVQVILRGQRRRSGRWHRLLPQQCKAVPLHPTIAWQLKVGSWPK